MTWLRSAFQFAAILFLLPPVSNAQSPQTIPRPETTVRRSVETSISEALLANPITASYRIEVESKNGKVVLKGRVGSKAAHDSAVRTAIAYGAPVADDLVIDSTVVPVGWAPFGNPGPVGRVPQSLLGAYTYPPSLFGRYDDPFYGLEPPPILYAPWWGELTANRLGPRQPVASEPPQASRLPMNTVEMTIDPLGVAVIRGTVPTEEDKTTIGKQLLQVEGVTRILNQLSVDPTAPQPSTALSRPAADEDQPPPPPTPSIVMPKANTAPPNVTSSRPKAPLTPSASPASRIDRAIQARPELAGLPIKITLREGVASLSGSVPSVYEAMVAYRSAQQTPGVKEVVDGLEFVVPDAGNSNPLLTKGKPEDVEPYLLAQIRRQVGEAAHIDRVRVGGHQLEVQGTLDRKLDLPRVEAILRSMPILRGFSISPEFRATEG